jgi:hypothetical protein
MEDKTVCEHDTGRTSIDVSATARTRPALTFDFQRYQKFVADSDLSEAVQREYLQTLFEIVVGFVDMGFDIDVSGASAQIALEADSPSVVEFDNTDINKQDEKDCEKGTDKASDKPEKKDFE